MWFYNENNNGNCEILNKDKEIIAILPDTNDILSKEVLLNSLKLFELCKKIQYISDKELNKFKEEALSLISSIENTSIDYVIKFPVAYINKADDCLNYSLNSKIEDLILFEEFYNGLGFIKLNIGGPEEYFIDEDTFYDIRVIKRNLVSKHVFNSIVELLKTKYIFSREFFKDYDKSGDSGLGKYLIEIIDTLCSERFKKTMSLYDYLQQYPLINAENGIIESTNSSPSFANCDFSIHSSFNIYINDNLFEGMFYYKKDDDKYYIYNIFKDELILSPILNKEDILKNTKIEFIDYIDS